MQQLEKISWNEKESNGVPFLRIHGRIKLHLFRCSAYSISSFHIFRCLPNEDLLTFHRVKRWRRQIFRARHEGRRLRAIVDGNDYLQITCTDLIYSDNIHWSNGRIKDLLGSTLSKKICALDSPDHILTKLIVPFVAKIDVKQQKETSISSTVYTKRAACGLERRTEVP